MPRKQRFKPSRKPKPVDQTNQSTTANDNGPSEPTQPNVMASEPTPSHEDVSRET